MKRKKYTPKTNSDPIPLRLGSVLKHHMRTLRRRLFRSLERGNKHICPLCDANCFIYKRSISSTQARQLLTTYKASTPGFMKDTGWVNVSDIYLPGASGDYGKMRFWGLIEKPAENDRVVEKGKAFWRITERGKQFIRGEITIPRYAYVYRDDHYYIDGECFEGPEVTFKDCLTAKFDLKELMAAPVRRKST